MKAKVRNCRKSEHSTRNVNVLTDFATSYQRDEYDGHFEGPVEVVLRGQPTTGKYERKR